MTRIQDVLQQSKGILYFLLIFSESSFRTKTYKWIKNMVLQRSIFVKEDKQEEGQKEYFQVNAFLCSSMNMELVCAILKGIQ